MTYDYTIEYDSSGNTVVENRVEGFYRNSGCGCGGWSEPIFYDETVNYEGFLANTVACGGVSGLDGNSFYGDSSCEFIPITEINVDFDPSNVPGMPSGPGVPEAINGLNFSPPSLTDEVCFVAGYEIELADGSIWKIEDLQVGQELWAPSHDDPNGSMRKCRISKVFHNDPKSTVIVRFDNGLELQGTENHPFWVPQRGWTSIADLQIGDSCVDKQGNAVSVVSKELVSELQPVYNIEVEGAHTYFIGKDEKYVLVHNDCEYWWNDSGWDYANPLAYSAWAGNGIVETFGAIKNWSKNNEIKRKHRARMTDLGLTQDLQDSYKADPNDIIVMMTLANTNVSFQTIAVGAAQGHVGKAALQARPDTKIINLPKNLNYSKKVKIHLEDPDRFVPEPIIKSIIKHGIAKPDPQKSSAIAYYGRIIRDRKEYNIKVLYDHATNSVWHVHYTTGATGPLKAIPTQ